MNPAWSVIVFTTVVGAAQGLVSVLALLVLAGFPPVSPLLSRALMLALLMALVALGASFLHLGRPERAWRAATMWRTSWLSREVIVLPAFIVLVAAWWLWLQVGSSRTPVWVALAALGLSTLLWLCTAMIYACLRFVAEWAHPLTLVNFMLIGLSSGGILAAALAAAYGDAPLVRPLSAWAMALTASAWIARASSLHRNDRLRPRSNLQSATGIRASPLVQVSMGMTGGAFNTREFFHRATAAGVKRVRTVLLACGFAVPTVLCAWVTFGGPVWVLSLAVLVQFIGLLAERWYFFAQARHPQNLYYQVVS